MRSLAAAGFRCSSTLYDRAARALWTTAAFAACFASAVLAQGIPAAPAVNALPSQGQVVSGSATMQRNATSLVVQQASDRLITNWQSFDIGRNANVRFDQPNAGSVALNRVLSNDPTSIFGSLSSNGQVFLINPSGVLFGSSARVDVGGLVASSLQLADVDFLAGRYRFAGAASSGSVVNQGRIDAASGGYVAFIAPRVVNGGAIDAPRGTVALGAGERASLDFAGDKLVRFTIDQGTLGALIENEGLVRAQGGSVVLSARAADAVTRAVVNQNGVVDASSMTARGGRIVLEGDAIILGATSRTSATGATGGGTVLVGGDWQGSGDLRPASRVTMQAGATIDASATQRGNGGEVVLWSDVGNADSITAVHGTISATGGAAGGDGGRVETSGHLLDTTAARVSAGAPKGSGGEWLLDPYNITVAASGASGTAYGANYTSGADSVILNTDIQNSLNSGTSVTLTTGSGGSSAGNINVNAGIAKTAGGDATLTLKATGDIRVNAGNNITSTAGKLNVVLWTDIDSSGGGTIWLGDVNNSIQTTINTNGGHFWAGGSGYVAPYASTVWNGLTVGAGYANSPTGGGTASWYGVQLNKTSILTGGGSVQLRGLGASTNGTQPQMGVYLGGASSISTGVGNLDIAGSTFGQTSNTPSVNYGFDLEGGSALSTTSGAVTIAGYSAGQANQAAGVQITSSTIATTSGSVTITGTTDTTAPTGSKHGVQVLADAAGRSAGVTTTSGAIRLDGTTSVSGSGAPDTSGVQLATANSVNTDTNNPTVKIVSQTGNVTIRGANPNNTSTASSNLAVRFNGTGYGKVYVGYDGVNPYSGNTDILGNSIGEGGFASGYLAMQGSGSLVIEPLTSTFVTPLSLTGSYALGSTHASLTLGSTTSTGDVTVSAAQTVAGPIAIYGGNVTLNGNLTITAAGAALLAKASGSVTTGVNTVQQTNGGAITLWSDSDASGDGFILLNESSKLDSRTAADRSVSRTTTASGGGDITLGGGNGVTAAAGYAASNGSSSNQGGVNFGDQTYNSGAHTNLTTLYSGGGNIVVRGRSSAGLMGLNWVNGGEINAGSTGNVTLAGVNTGSGHGIELASFRSSGTAVVTAGGNLQITGSAVGTGDAQGVQSSVATLTALGSGGITITGSAATGSSNLGIKFTNSSLLALAGSGGVTFNGGAQGISVAGGTVGRLTGSNVPTTTGNVTFTGNTVTFGGATTVDTTGTLVIEPSGNNFSSATQYPLANLTVVSGVTGLRLGKDIGTATHTDTLWITSAQTVNGPISLYAGSININGNLTITAPGAALFAKASGSVITGANSGPPTTQQTNGGAITLWSDSDASGDGFILLGESTKLDSRTTADRTASRTTTASGGGDITLGGGNGASAALGYATSNGSNASQGGVNFGEATYNNNAHTNLTTIDSGGGNIVVRGKSSTNIQGFDWVNGGEINGGSTGSVTLEGVNTGTGHGFELAAFRGTGTATVIAGGNLQITGTVTGTGGANGVQSGGSSLQSVGTGNITITGSSANTSNRGITGNFDVLAGSGPIALNGGTQGVYLTGTIGRKSSSNVTTSASNATVTGDNVVFTGASTVDTTGALAIEPYGNNFAATLQFPLTNLTVAGALTGLRLGKDLGTTAHTDTITIGTAQTIAGPIGVYAGTVNLNANLTTTAAGAGLMVKASGAITTAASTAFQTANGPLTLWSDSDANLSGAIALGNSTTFNSAGGATGQQTGGGRITLAGGADTNADGLPDGYAFSTSAHGIAFGTTSASAVSLNSGGGDVFIKGKTSASTGVNYGVGAFGTLTVLSGQGAIAVTGESAASYGVEFSNAVSAGTGLTLSSAKPSGTAIAITGISTGTNQHGVVFDFDGVENIYATGGGDIAIAGTGTGTGYGVWLQNTNVLAASGNIGIDGGSGGINVASGATGSRIGKSSTGVTTSSSAITLTGNRFNLAAPLTIDSTGTATVQSSGAAFTSALTTANLALGGGLTGFTLGRTTNNADITIAGTVGIAGPVSVYGGNIVDNGAVASSAANAGVLLEGTGKITANANITTSGGDITLWADSAGAATGGIEVKNGRTLSSGGGWITLGGSANGVAIAGLPATSSNGTVLPQGYAQNGTTSAGVSLGSDPGATFTDAGIAINSGNGRIGVAGQSTNYVYDGSSAYYSFGVAAYNGANLNAGTGDIVVYGQATGAGGAAHYNYGSELAPFGTNGTLPTLWKTSGGAISVYGSASGASAINTGISIDGGTGTVVTLENLGTSGGTVTLNGAASGSSGAPVGVRVYNANLLGASGSIAVNANGAGLPLNTIGTRTLNLGAAAGTDVTASSAAITLTADSLGTAGSVNFKTTGALAVQPWSTSFSTALSWPATNYTVIGTLGGLTLGKQGSTADITVASAQTVAGPIALYGGNLVINAGLTATGSTITLAGSGNVTEGASGFVAASNLLLLGGNVALNNAANAIGTLAASGVGGLSYIDTDALTLGTVGGTNGISASGVVSIATRGGDLTVAQGVATSSAGATALTLNAGLNATAGTSTGGNLIVSGSPAVTVGSGGKALLYSGSVAGSTGLTALVGSGSGRFRYDSDESATNYSAALGTGLNAIYREQPTVTRAVNDQTVVYGTAPAFTYSINGQNGDTDAQAFAATPTTSIGGATSTSGSPIVGAHTVSGTGGGSSRLGYAVAGSITPGTLSVTPKTLTVAYSGTDKIYDGGTSATVTRSGDDRIGGDVLIVAWTGAAFATKDAAGGIAVQVTGVGLSGGDAANYSVGNGSTTATIAPRTITLSGSKIYDGTTGLTGSVTIGGLVGTETLTYTGATASDAHVATSGKYVGAITLANGTNGGLAGNYALPTLDVAHAPVTIAARAIGGTATIGGTLTKTYDGTTTATGASVTGNVTGAIVGDTLALTTGGFGLAYDSAHVAGAAHIAVTGSGGFAVSASTSGSLASDYSFTAPIVSAVAGSITPATLVASLTNTGVTKGYDGTTAAPTAFAPAFSFTGLVSGDTAASLLATGASFDSAHVVGASAITVSGLSIASIAGSRGSASSDYVLDATSKTAAATITPKAVTSSATIGGTTTKVYDGTTTASGATVSGNVAGAIVGDALSLGLGSVTLAYDSAHVAAASSITASGSGTLVIGSSSANSVASDYQFVAPTIASATAHVTPATLTSTLTNAGVTKVYDGTMAAPTAFAPTFSFTGLVSGDTAATLTNTGASFDSAHVVGASGITVAGLGIGSIAGSRGSATSDYALDATAKTAAATITPKTVTSSATIGGTTTKVYDGTTAASGATVSGTVGGAIAGDSLSLDASAVTLAYDNAHVAGATSISASGTGALVIGTTSTASVASDYQLTAPTIASATAHITPATLTSTLGNPGVTKAYDGTTAAPVAFVPTFSFTGLVSGDTAATLLGTGAAFDNAHVASASAITVSGLSIGSIAGSRGSASSDYVLDATSKNVAAGIAPKTVTSNLTIGGTTTKVYDGTTAASGATLAGSVGGAIAGDTLTLDTSAVNLAYDSAHVAGASAIVASGQAALVIGTTSASSVASDYQLGGPTVASVAAHITPRGLTSTLTNVGVTKGYDGTTAAPTGLVPTFSFSGLLAGDTGASLVAAGAAYDSAHVAAASALAVSGLSIGSITGSRGSASSDYALDATSKTVAATITPRSLASTATIVGTTTKVYDGTTAAPGATVTGSVGGAIAGDSLSLDTGAVILAYDSAHVANASAIVATGTGALVIGSSSAASAASDYHFVAPTIAGAAARVTPAPLTATLVDSGVTKVYDGTTAAPTTFAPTFSVTGLVNGDSGATLTSAASAYDSAHVASATSVVVSGLGIGGIAGSRGSVASDYALDATSESVAARITPRALTASGFTALDKVYDGTTAAVVSGGSARLVGVIAGDDVAVAVDTAGSFDTKNVGTGKAVSFTGVSLAGSGASDYVVAGSGTTTAAITPRSLVATGFTATGRAYDGTTTAAVDGSAATLLGVIGGDTVGVGGGTTGLFDTKDVGAVKPVAVVGVALTGLDAGNYRLGGSFGTTAAITPKALTAVAAASDKVYDGTTAAATSLTLAGLVGNETLGTASTGTFNSRNVAAATTVTVGSVTLSDGTGGGLARNYALAAGQTASARITPAPLALAGANGLAKTYDGTTALPLDQNGIVGTLAPFAGDAVSLVGTPVFSAAGAGNRNIQRGSLALAGADAGNYALGWTDGSGVIGKANLTVRANDDARFVTQADNAGYNGASYGGFVHGETTSELGGALTIARSNPAVGVAGSYSGVLVPGGLTADNYNLTFAPGNFTIVPAGQLLVRVVNASTVYGSAPTYTVASAQYLDGTNVIRTLAAPMVVGNTYTYVDGAGGTAVFTVAPTAPVTSGAGQLAVGNFAMTASDVVETSANFSNRLVVTGNLSVTQKPVEVGAGGASKVYDGTTAMTHLTVDLVGKAPGDDADVSGRGSFASKNAGTGLAYSVTGLALGGADAGNYYLAGGTALAGADGSITPRRLTVAFTGADKVYDGGTVATVSTVDNRVVGDTLTVNRDAAFADKNVGVGKPVSIAGVSLSGPDANNYSVASTGTTSANISRLSSVTWTGGANGNWFDPANWAGGAVPDLANVAKVVIPNGATVAFGDAIVAPAERGPVQIDRLDAATGGLAMTAGALDVGIGGIDVARLVQTGGSLSTAGALAVTQAYRQGPAGTIVVAGATRITTTEGDTVLGNLSSGGLLTLTTRGGAITQAPGTAIVAHGGASLIARQADGSAADIALTASGNDFIGRVDVDARDASLTDRNGLALGQVAVTGDLLLVGHGDLDLGQGRVGGRLTAHSDNGDVTQNGTMSVGSGVVIDAGTGRVALQDPSLGAPAQTDGADDTGGNGRSSIELVAAVDAAVEAALQPSSGLRTSEVVSGFDGRDVRAMPPLAVMLDPEADEADRFAVVRFTVADGAGDDVEFDAERIPDGLRIRPITATGARLVARARSRIVEGAIEAVMTKFDVPRSEIRVTYLAR